MVFNSFEFIAFFAVVWVLYTMLAHRAQNLMLLGASYVFYAAWDVRFLSLLILSTVVDYHAGRVMGGNVSPRARKCWLAASLLTNLGILGIFKYADFFSENFAALLSLFGCDPGFVSLNLVLPMGISFYTFQTMSYSVDVYRRRLTPVSNVLDFALYVSYFPQLVAGPIERAERLLPQLARPRFITFDHLRRASWLILIGYFMKTVVADNLAPFVNAVFDDPASAKGLEIPLALLAFAFQIYGDFAGYSCIARGVSLMMGIELMVNFRMPYFAVGPSDFWRRWHISLSSWLRDYLFIPLGGSRGSTFNTLRNLMLTMLLGGLWHGSQWHFVAWGGFHGILLVLYRNRELPSGPDDPWTFRRCMAALWFFGLTLIGWALFRVNHLGDIGVLVHNTFHEFTFNGVVCALTLLCFAAPLIWLDAVQERARNAEQVLAWSLPRRAILYAFLFSLILLAGSRANYAFIYFQF